MTLEAAERRSNFLLEGVIAYGNFIFRRRNIVFPVVTVGLMAGFLPVLPYGDSNADWWLNLVGYGIAFLGQALRVLVVGLEYIKRGGLNKRIYAARLVTGGMFATSRNPLYLGNLITLAGLLVIHNSTWVYGLCGGFFLFTYWALVIAEERYLRRQFGAEYDAYAARVPRWLPRLSSLPEAFRGMRFNWRRAIAKEYSSCGSWLATALAINLYEVLAVQGARTHEPALIAIGAAFALLVICLSLIRVLKKRSVLRDV
jgi:protein-S-isoprenylcysteine O-methyltransferase Ste14